MTFWTNGALFVGDRKRVGVFLSTAKHSVGTDYAVQRQIISYGAGPLHALSDILLTHDWRFGPPAWSMDRLVEKIIKLVVRPGWPIKIVTTGRRGMPDECTYQLLRFGTHYHPADKGDGRAAALEIYDMLCEEEIVEHPSQTLRRDRLEEWLAPRLLVLEKP